MNVLIAPNNFKESISAANAAKCIESGIRSITKEINTVCLPLSDGGEGFVDALINAAGGSRVNCVVQDPLGRDIETHYGVINEDTAVIEMALASGLERLRDKEKDPWVTTSFGTGQLIYEAIEKGFRNILIGIGGSATNDTGLGMLQAMGVDFFDVNGMPVSYGGAQALSKVHRIDTSRLDELINEVSFTVACDVINPLFGTNGATYVYGGQKGADQKRLDMIEAGVCHFHHKTVEIRQLDFSQNHGAGAAGGIGYALMAYLRAKMRSGFDIVAQVVSLEEQVKRADVILTGEGKIDAQTLHGKVVFRLAKLAFKNSKSLIVIGGVLDESVVLEGVKNYFSISQRAKNLKDSMENVEKHLFDIGIEIAHGWSKLNAN
ncbi:MAG: glycerate kinase [Bacteroidota bacterium]